MCKTNYPDLEVMVNRLVSINKTGECGKRKRIKQLQKICEKLLNEYHIKINDDIIIEPLLMEVYYYHEGKFEDENTYQEKGQSNRFGKLFLHPPKYSPGIDICLSLSDTYFLSFLIKVAKIDGKVYKQEGINNILFEKNLDVENLENILQSHRKDSLIICVPRKNTYKGNFSKAPLAALSIETLKNELEADAIAKSSEKGYQKQWQCSIRALTETTDEEKAREKAKEYNNAKIEDKYWNLAKESLGYNNL